VESWIVVFAVAVVVSLYVMALLLFSYEVRSVGIRIETQHRVKSQDSFKQMHGMDTILGPTGRLYW
jgi:fatty-acid desaturase